MPIIGHPNLIHTKIVDLTAIPTLDHHRQYREKTIVEILDIVQKDQEVQWFTVMTNLEIDNMEIDMEDLLVAIVIVTVIAIKIETVDHMNGMINHRQEDPVLQEISLHHMEEVYHHLEWIMEEVLARQEWIQVEESVPQDLIMGVVSVHLAWIAQGAWSLWTK